MPTSGQGLSCKRRQDRRAWRLRAVRGVAGPALAALLAACATTEVVVVDTVSDDGVDYAVTGSAVQWTDVPPLRRLIVRCYCPTRTTRAGTDPNRVELRFDGRKDSVGYHGDQAVPTAMPESLMRFIARPHPTALLVESREYTYIHHAFLLSRIEVVAPADVVVTFEPLDRDALEGRRVP